MSEITTASQAKTTPVSTTMSDMEARKKEEEQRKQAREAEWVQLHPAWFGAMQRDDLDGLRAQVTAPGFDIDQVYSVVTAASPLGWAVISDRADMVKLLIEMGANKEIPIKFWGNQTWSPKDYAQRYRCDASLKMLNETTPVAKNVDVD